MGIKNLTPFLLPQAIAITFAGAIFLGFYLISVAFANRWLVFTDDGWKIRRNIHWYTLSITNITAVLVLIAQSVTLSTSMAEASYVEEGNQLADHEDPPWKAIVRCTVSGIVVLLANSLLENVSPLDHLCEEDACHVVKNIHDKNYGPYRWSTVSMTVGPGIVFLPFLASTIALSAYCTGLLIRRLWIFLKDSENSSTTRQIQFLIRVLMESGVLYLAISIAHFFVYFGHDNFAIHMVGLLHTTIIGIAYNLIIIRVGQNRSEEEHYSTTGKLTTFQVAEISHIISTDFGSTSDGTDGVTEASRDKRM
ncbi:hypothetical protein Agabi119p4_6691 [Agaricus bisporus var. burnettii]|uniref:Uncharacterized protein n=1 Tax=Agaricus bisporus var. burnettii TaxID=192524 RepID=A0A8H7CDW6_AGABI|nr:hypothetical protein Agabi119p4_6691 [Agaricus bisporus var. burnettii]